MAFLMFLPLFAESRDFWLSLQSAAPILLIGICTFIANDINDVEKDKVNHPERPLASGKMDVRFAVVLYFSALIAALFLIRAATEGFPRFLYFTLLLAAINYQYVVEFFPLAKSLYVAATCSLLVMSIAFMVGKWPELGLLAAAGFLFVLGREICMDIRDLEGDKGTLPDLVPADLAAGIAFILQLLGIALLAVLTENIAQGALLILATAIFLLSLWCWKKSKRRQSIHLMKLELLFGLAFLL